MSDKKNGFKSLIEGAKAKDKTTVPLQSDKDGSVKPVEKTFLLSLPELQLMALKKLAVDRRTNVRRLIADAITEKYF